MTSWLCCDPLYAADHLFGRVPVVAADAPGKKDFHRAVTRRGHWLCVQGRNRREHAAKHTGKYPQVAKQGEAVFENHASPNKVPWEIPVAGWGGPPSSTSLLQPSAPFMHSIADCFDGASRHTRLRGATRTDTCATGDSMGRS